MVLVNTVKIFPPQNFYVYGTTICTLVLHGLILICNSCCLPNLDTNECIRMNMCGIHQWIVLCVLGIFGSREGSMIL